MTNDMHGSVRLPREERDRLFLKLHTQGMTLCHIRWETGFAEETIRRALHRQGVTWKRRPDARKPGPKPNDAMAQAMCNECGNVRKARAAYLTEIVRKRPLRCAVCDRSTDHFPIRTDPERDFRERLNAEVNEQARLAVRLKESVAMLDRLGIRFELVESDEWYAKIWRERGRGSEVCFIDLAADLTLAEQVTYLAVAWRYLLPAAESRWLNAWVQDEDDPEMEWSSIWWPRRAPGKS
jgi:hypothetical protein